MKVILQLVLIVMPGFIRSEAIDVTAGRTGTGTGKVIVSNRKSSNGLSMGIKNFERDAGRQRFASYERDLVVKLANGD